MLPARDLICVWEHAGQNSEPCCRGDQLALDECQNCGMTGAGSSVGSGLYVCRDTSIHLDRYYAVSTTEKARCHGQTGARDGFASMVEGKVGAAGTTFFTILRSNGRNIRFNFARTRSGYLLFSLHVAL